MVEVRKYKCFACKACKANYVKIYDLSKKDMSHYRFVVVKRFKEIVWKD